MRREVGQRRDVRCRRQLVANVAERGVDPQIVAQGREGPSAQRFGRFERHARDQELAGVEPLRQFDQVGREAAQPAHPCGGSRQCDCAPPGVETQRAGIVKGMADGRFANQN